MNKIFFVALTSFAFYTISCEKAQVPDTSYCIAIKFIGTACNEALFQVLEPQKFPGALSSVQYVNQHYDHVFVTVLGDEAMSAIAPFQLGKPGAKTLFVRYKSPATQHNFRICTVGLLDSSAARHEVSVSEECARTTIF